MVSKRNIVAIVGTTGVGKSQLAIDLALALKEGKAALKGAEVINADSMQVYKGLDIITNKATREEMQDVPHHLMDFVDPGQEYRIDRFQADATQKIEEIAGRENLPIIVGGTMYFMQHLLFPGNLVSVNEDTATHGPLPAKLQDLDERIQERAAQLPPELLDLLFLNLRLPSISSSSSFPPGFPMNELQPPYDTSESLSSGLHKILQILDPPVAAKWHWRDIRKIRRSLEIIVQQGRPYSEIMQEQKGSKEESPYRALIFWLHAQAGQLDPRLDGRVEQMVDRGLLREILDLRSIAKENLHVDLTKGVYQSIGYKEFTPYLDALEDARPDSTKIEDLFRAGLADMKLGTRQYARRQVKWIRNKLLPEVVPEAGNQEVYLYTLDATDPAQWKENVSRKAGDIVAAFLGSHAMPDPAFSEIARDLLQPKPTGKDNPTHAHVVCSICTVDPARPILIGEGAQMAAHIQSRAHRKRLKKAPPAKRGELDEPCGRHDISPET